MTSKVNGTHQQQSHSKRCGSSMSGCAVRNSFGATFKYLTNDTFMFVVLSETSSVTNINTCLPIVLNVDGAVIHSYQKEALWVWSEQQREWRVSADVLGEEERAGGRELIQVAVERHHKLICHQQSLVLRRETEWERHPGYVLSMQISWFQHEILQNNWILRDSDIPQKRQAGLTSKRAVHDLPFEAV